MLFESKWREKDYYIGRVVVAVVIVVVAVMELVVVPVNSTWDSEPDEISHPPEDIDSADIRSRQALSMRPCRYTVTQGDVEQADPTSTGGSSLPVVIRPADVHQSTDRLMDIKRRRQSVLVTV